MKITPKNTIRDVIFKNNSLFSLGVKQITEYIQELPNTEFVPLKRRFWFDKRIPARDVSNLTMGELNAIEVRTPSYEYFCIVLGLMLGFVKFNKVGVDGKPEWDAGFVVDDKKIERLRFIRAEKYFIYIQKELENVSKSWKNIEMPLSASEKKINVKRPNRGLVSICRKYCQLMNGAVDMNKAWNTPWPNVYEAFESCKFDNLEQRAIYESNKSKKHTR